MAAVDHAIAGVTAYEVMSRDCPSVPGDMSLAEFVEQFLLHSGRRCYLVGESQASRGIITLSDVLSVPRDEWGQTSVQAAMRRADQIYSVSPDAALEDALRLMDEKNVAQVPVMRAATTKFSSAQPRPRYISRRNGSILRKLRDILAYRSIHRSSTRNSQG
jgi:CBS domain-containing protein